MTVEQHKTWLKIANCTCPFAWRSLGRLHGVTMGHGWVRMSTDRACPHHAKLVTSRVS
jgi:hypothetical protein